MAENNRNQSIRFFKRRAVASCAVASRGVASREIAPRAVVPRADASRAVAPRAAAFALICALCLASCAVHVQVPVVKQMPPTLLHALGGNARVGVLAVTDGAHARTWAPVLGSLVKEHLAAAGFYRIVDLSSRQDRLRDLIASRSGLTEGLTEIGQELSVDAFLILEMSRPPLIECEVTIPFIQQKKGVTTRQGLLHVGIFAAARLVVVETGTEIVAREFRSHEYYAVHGDPACPTPLKALPDAIEKTAKAIAAQLSPTMSRYEVPLLNDSRGAPPETAERVKDYLSQGIRWYAAGNRNRAAESWMKAREIANNNCPAASWNLALLHWRNGDLQSAASFFDEVDRLNPGDFLTSKMMDVISEFDLDHEIKKGGQ